MDNVKQTVKHCDACIRDNETIEGTQWCCDCAETLCTNCGNVHIKSRFSTTHRLIRLQDIQNTHSFLLTSSFMCESHPDRKVSFYCNRHETLLCQNCLVQTHKDCKNITEIDKLDVKESSRYRDLEVLHQQTTRLSQSLKKIISEKRENLNKLNLQKKIIETDIIKMRADIEEHLSNLEKELTNSLNIKHHSCVQQIEEELTELSKSQHLLDIPESDFRVMNTFASDSYKFTLIKRFDLIKLKTDDIIFELSENNKLLGLEFTKSEIPTYAALGWIDIKVKGKNETATTTPILSGKPKQNELPQIQRGQLSPNSDRKLKGEASPDRFNSELSSRHSLVSYTSFPVTSALGENVRVSRGCFIPDRHLLLCDSRNRYIYRCNLYGTYSNRIPLLYTPHDVDLFDKTKAIVCAGDRGLQIINITEGHCKPDVFIKPGGKCTAITCVDDQVLVRNGNSRISILDIHGNSILKINTKYDPYFITADVFGSIYWTSNNADELQCIATERTQYLYTSDNLIGPSGLATDQTGHVYVAGYDSGNVHRLSNSHNKAIVVIEGIHRPWDLSFDKETKKLLIVHNEGDIVSIYSVTD